MVSRAERTSLHSAGWRYRGLTRAACIVFISHAIYKTIATRENRYFHQRLGFAPKFDQTKNQPLQWWHAASVGEIQTLWPLLQSVMRRTLDKDPKALWLVTTNTTTGHEVLKQRLQQTGLQDRVIHTYSPIDTPGITKRFIRRIQPESVVMMETEIWPNLYTELHNHNVPITIVNARVTDKTLSAVMAGHRLASTLKPAYNAALNGVRILARSEHDANGYQLLGAEDSQLKVVGNLKFADNRPPNNPCPIDAMTLNKPYVVAASTHAPEEEQLAAQWMKQSDAGLLVIVPRHIERAEKLHKTLFELYGKALADRRSLGGKPNNTHRLYLADTLGELHNWYAGASAAFVGGSLIARGGHNVLEPYFHRLPVVTGPNTDNFQDAVLWLHTQQAITEVADANAVIRTLIENRNSGLKLDQTKQNDLLNVYSNFFNVQVDD